MLCSPLGPSSWKPWPSLGLHRARPADQRFNLPHPSFPTQAPKTQNENWWLALTTTGSERIGSGAGARASAAAVGGAAASAGDAASVLLGAAASAILDSISYNADL